MDIDSFIIHIKTEDVYEDITYNVEKRFYISNSKVDRPLQQIKTEK